MKFAVFGPLLGELSKVEGRIRAIDTLLERAKNVGQEVTLRRARHQLENAREEIAAQIIHGGCLDD